MDIYDVAVIGSGPSGSMAARYAAKGDASTILLEEHPSIGWPVECGGLLGLKAIHESELSAGKFIIRGLKGAMVYSPGGVRLSFKARSYKAWVVDRRLFDRAMALEAIREGAELRLASPVREVLRENGISVLIIGDGIKIGAKVVISAEGVRARIARKTGLRPPEKVLSGAQVEVPFRVNDTEGVEVHLGVAPGLFAWVIPLKEDTARIGLCVWENACGFLKEFLNRDIIRKRLMGSPVALVVGGLPLGPPTSTVVDGFLAVGDAAGQVKPTSGGGIYPGMVCAKIAGGVAAAAALEGDCSAGRLQEYDKRWRAELGRELEIGMRANWLLNTMSDEELDEIFSYIGSKHGLLKAIEEHGDIDRPSLLIARMFPHVGIDGIRFAKLLRYALG